MAEKDDKSLIGFDPLAWMSEEGEQEDDIALPVFDGSNSSDKKKSSLESEQAIETAVVESSPSTEPVQSAPIIEAQTNGKLVLVSELKIQNVKALYEELTDLLANNDIIEIDASEVTSIDTSSLQLLTIFKQEMEYSDKLISIDFPSDKFVEASDLLGLSEVLGVDKPESGFF